MSHKHSTPNRIGHYIAKEQILLSDCLMQHFGLTIEESDRLISFGAIYQDRVRVGSNRILFPGQYIRVHMHPKRFPIEGIEWTSRIVHHDRQFIVVNKPAGIPVHATLDNQLENVLHQLRRTLGGSVYVTQRLDIEVGGLMVFARTPEFQRQFNRLLVERKVKKRYRALVTSAPKVGRHLHYMEPAERSPKTIHLENGPNWLECALTVVRVTSASCTVPAPHTFEVEIDLETGRTHQIRVQLAALGSPVVGDKLYGSRTAYHVDGTRLPGIGLFSTSTTWTGTDGKEWSFMTAPPWAVEQH